jgi:hypothetical protein
MTDPLAGDVDLPAVGKVSKKIIIPVAVVAVGFVGWRFYMARQGDGTDEATTDPGYDDPGVLPAVSGAVDPDNAYGSGAAPAPSTDDYGFNGTTNSQWTQYTAGQLAQSDRWSFTDILEALGSYLAGKPLTALQQSIVNSAVAIGGTPPVGTHVVVPGGNTPITIAPTGVKIVSTTTTSVTLSFNSVSGAAGYRAYRGGGSNVGSSTGTTITVSHLEPNTSYSLSVAAVTASGATGPHSSPVSGKTKGVNLSKPSTPTVSNITKTSAHVRTGAVSNADGYNWYLNGVAHGHSDGPTYTLSGLKSRTPYKVTVRADTSTGAPGPVSSTRSFKTK